MPTSIEINPRVSPRIITVFSPATMITVQELVNLVMDWEDEPWNMTYERIIKATGKQELGGGVLVGITATLLNAKLKFEDRGSPTICNVTGGNLVAVDSNGASVYPLEYSTNVMATITASSSATLQEQIDIQYASFNNEVTINIVTGVSGTSFPIGTRRQPVNNLNDAKAIANERGFNTLCIIGEFTLNSGESLSNYTIRGEGATFNVFRTNITLALGCITSNTFYEDLYIAGVQGGESTYSNCIIGDLENTHCHFEYCGLIGPLQVSNTGGFLLTHHASYNYCYTTHEWLEIDYNNSPLNTTYSDFSGRVKFSNLSNANADLIIRLASGMVWLDSTCTTGNVKVNGIGEIVDESNGTTVNIVGLVTGGDIQKIKKIEQGRWKILNNQMIFYDSDGITPLVTFDLKDADGNPAEQNIYERVPIV